MCHLIARHLEPKSQASSSRVKHLRPQTSVEQCSKHRNNKVFCSDGRKLLSVYSIDFQYVTWQRHQSTLLALTLNQGTAGVLEEYIPLHNFIYPLITPHQHQSRPQMQGAMLRGPLEKQKQTFHKTTDSGLHFISFRQMLNPPSKYRIWQIKLFCISVKYRVLQS